MPSINPSRLKRQVDEAMALAGDRERFVRAIREILEYYADRTRRSTAASEALLLSNVLRVPRPVLAALCAGVQTLAELPDGERLGAAQELWELNYRETRHVAVCLMQGVPPGERPEHFERWAAGCDDRVVLSWIAEQGLRDWWQAAGDDAWRVLRGWLGAGNHGVRHLALLALQKRIDSGASDSILPAVFRLLKGAAGEVRGDSFTTLAEILELLARRSPQETARYLMDEVKRKTPGSRRLARACSQALPPDLQQMLDSVL